MAGNPFATARRIGTRMAHSVATACRLTNNAEAVRLSLQSMYRGHHRTTYRGVKAIRCPFDYVIYQMIISRVQPDLIIEVGTHEGGGALYMADMMQLCAGKGVVHTIDVNTRVDDRVKGDERIKVFNEGWEAYDLSNAEGFETIMVVEDAAHTYDCTLGAIKKLAPLVTPESYLIVEDGILSALGMGHDYGGGPLKAIREFLEPHPDFEIDRYWCDLYGQNATFNPNGYWKRKA